MEQKALRFYLTLIPLGISFILTALIFWPFLQALALALIFAVILRPLYRAFHQDMPNFPGFSALLTVIAGIMGIFVPLIVLGALLVHQAEDMYVTLAYNGSIREYLQIPLTGLNRIIGAYFPGTQLFDAVSFDLDSYIRGGLQWIIDNLSSTFSKVASIVVSFFVFFFSLFYILRDGTDLKRAVLRLSPLSSAQNDIILDRLALAINSVIKGNLAIALIQGVLTAAGFTIFGVQNSILWGTLAAVGSLIPGVGTSLVFVPAALIMFFTGNVFAAIGLAIWGMLAVGLVDNFLGPRLIGERMHLHPLAVLLAVLGGVMLFGPVGVFLGPISVSLFFTLLALHSDMSKKGAKAEA